jgi:hypothetical protein
MILIYVAEDVAVSGFRNKKAGRQAISACGASGIALFSTHPPSLLQLLCAAG